MAARDAAVIAGGVSQATLVDRAGGAVARGARRLVGGAYGRRVVIVCGKGNNGADGRVAGERLAGWGARVDRFDLAGIERAVLDKHGLNRALGRADLAVDAMFGTGFRGPLEGDAAFAADALTAAPCPVLAVDIPSGVDGLTGAVRGAAVEAMATVCLAALKPGLVLHPGAALAGDVEVADIGIDPGTPPPSLGVTEEADVAGWLPRREPESHKWSVGGVYVVGGSQGMTGAVMLASRAALRAGAGIVVAGLPGDAAPRASGGEVITRSLPATPAGALDEAAAEEVLDGLDRFRALVVGPGLGQAPATVAAVRRLVAEAPIPLVLDADGLNALDGDVDLLAGRRAATVITPHAGEYARLAGEKVGEDRIGAARRLAERAGAVVVLKGSRTVIADPTGRAAINTTGGPWLATAGTGDVLSGMVGALTAIGLPAFRAAAAGAWVHGRAADEAGHAGLVAGDLIDALPTVLAGLTARSPGADAPTRRTRPNRPKGCR
ncbi:MAG: ADP-dependent NAD(P)H-hydrate dehydratase / NAD(P)H-hydrate epimerase [Actinomycetota bacterium]|nr:ADP-dependent NAD(P)H-hydrate dehydratase / NAD(P)H-hydrate epimerase [Actinomycetota bacterium]